MGKRNIVLITWDSVRADHCSFVGYHRETTPTLDRMARKGLYFENAISPAHATLPSMKAILTGEFLGQHKPTLKDVRECILHEFKTQSTIAEILRKKGYYTIGFSSNAWASSHFGFDKGFMHFIDPFSKKSEFKLYRKIFNRIDKSKIFSILRNIKNMLLKEEVFATWEKYYHQIITHTEKLKEPFFLWIFLTDTHLPYYSPKAYRKWSDIIDMNIFNIYYTWKLKSKDFIIKPSEKMLKVLINAYDDSIRYADVFVNKLWNDLKDRYDPIFIIHADHGDGFYEHGFFGHYHPTLYEENIHVPFVIYNSDLKGIIEEPTSLIDLSSITLKILENKNNLEEIFSKEIPKVVISKALGTDGKLRVSVRIMNWKYVVGQKDTDELYDLESDPKEQENLIQEYPKIAEEMKRIAKNFVRQELEKRKIRAIVQRLQSK